MGMMQMRRAEAAVRSDLPAEVNHSEENHILLILLLCFTAIDYLYHGLFRPLITEKADFEAYYNAALALRFGQPVYDLMVQFFKEGPAVYNGPYPYVYPPPFAVFLTPLGYLDFKSAALLWLAFNQALFFGGMALLVKTIWREPTRLELAAVIFVCMNFRPLFIDYLLGQCNILLFFLIVSALYGYRSGKDVMAGVALGFAIVIKVIPAFILFYFLWKRAYRVFITGVLTIMAILAFTLPTFPLELYVEYFKFMMDQSLFNAFPDNHSLTGFFTRLMTRSVWVTGPLDSPAGAKALVGFCSLLLLGVFLWVTRKPCSRNDHKTLYEYGLAVVSMLLLSQVTTTPYLVMMLIPWAVWVHGLLNGLYPRKWAVISAVAWAVTAVWYPPPVDKFLKMDIYGKFLSGIWVNIFSLQLAALIILWCLLGRALSPGNGWKGRNIPFGATGDE